jgi:hypothetical protein
MNCGPISQEQLETFRAASSQICKTWDQLVEPIKKFGEKYGSAQISECGGFMDRTPEAEAKFRKALVKAGLLQDNSNIQPPMIRQFFLYPYDTLFPPKETTNGKTEDNRSQIDSTESHGQIRDSASLDCDTARDQSHHRDTAQNERQPQKAESKLRTGDLRGNPESDRGCSMSKKDKIEISVGEAYWVLGMFKKLESICLEINSLPMTLRPEIKDFRDRLRQKLREMEARERERAQ